MAISEAERRREIFERRIDEFNILDDTFMNEVFRDQPELVGMVLRIILGIDDLVIQELRIQDSYTNWQGRGIRIDVFARDTKGKLYDIEIQRKKHGAGAKRARFNLSLMDAAYTKAGTELPDPAETYIVFVTETDIFNRGFALYHVERIIQEIGEAFEDGAHIVYVNGAYVGDGPIGSLMYDFRCSNPAMIKNEALKDRVQALKSSPEWRDSMCQAMEDTREEGRAEGWAEGLREGRAEGRKEGRAEGLRVSVFALCRLVEKNRITLQEAITESGLTEQEFLDVAHKLGYHGFTLPM